MEKINIGIVGIGMMLEYHFNAFSKIPNTFITGCTRDYYGDSEQRKNQKLFLKNEAKKLGIKAYSNYDEMINDSELNAIIIASINPYHFDHIIKALNSGKNVLVEKPVVTDFNHLEKIIEKSNEKNLLIFPSHNFVYRPVISKAKEIMNSGALGTIVYSQFISCFRSNEVHAHGWRSSAKLSSGGALMDSGHHQVYQSLYLLGMPEKIHGFKTKQVLTHGEVEDFAMINAYYKNGSIANIGQGHASNFGDAVSGIKIVGEKGNLVITDACYFNGDKVATDADYANSFYHQANYFVDCILENKKPLSGLEEVRDTLAVIYAAYQSAESDKVIHL